MENSSLVNKNENINFNDKNSHNFTHFSVMDSIIEDDYNITNRKSQNIQSSPLSEKANISCSSIDNINNNLNSPSILYSESILETLSNVDDVV